ncbi:MAG: hypothetical protein ABJC10_03090 [Acidobacteriota bacterium]
MRCPYLGFAALAVGEGDAAGEGLATGLGFVVAGAAVSLAGEAVVFGGGVFELVAGSQPTTKAIASSDDKRSVVRPIGFILGLLISLASFEQD